MTRARPAGEPPDSAGTSRIAAIGLGSSLGDAARVLALAARLLDTWPGIRVVRSSRIYWSAPAGGVAKSAFLNAVVLVQSSLSPAALVAAAHAVEQRLGRQPTRRWADRVIDLDVLLMDGIEVESPVFVPHPRLCQRAFALVPLVEVWPEATLPGRTERLRELPAAKAYLPVAGVLPAPPPGRYPALGPCRGRSPVVVAPRTGVPMKFFLDTANLDEIREAATWGIIDGVTTNPSLIAKEGRDFVDTIYQICNIVDGPVSAETVAQDAPKMIEEGRLLARVHKNVVVKVPLTIEGIKTCKALSGDGIRVNVTLCFQAAQALIAAKAGATYISPFVGRLDDVSEDGMKLISDIVKMYANYPSLTTQVLAASIRHPIHIVAAAAVGSHVCTAPLKVYKQLYSHPLTDKGNAAFLKDWETVPDRDIIGQVQRWLAKEK